jgi:hypothetical protein
MKPLRLHTQLTWHFTTMHWRSAPNAVLAAPGGEAARDVGAWRQALGRNTRDRLLALGYGLASGVGRAASTAGVVAPGAGQAPAPGRDVRDHVTCASVIVTGEAIDGREIAAGDERGANRRDDQNGEG